MKTRHRFCYRLVRPLAGLFLWLKFGFTCKVARDLPEKYIVLSNHTTDYDFLMLAASFPEAMYFVGSEHIARWKFLYRIINYFFAFITRPKGATASSTVMEMLRAVKNGGNVCLFAEGSRCWDGVTGPILPSTGKVVKKAKCGLVTYRIEGGYFANPRWAGGNTRRGRVYGAPVNVYTPQQLEEMTSQEIYDAIVRDLHEDAYARQLAHPAPYRGKALAERMETALFICPQCGKIDTLHSRDDSVSCSACAMRFRYDRHGMLQGAPAPTFKELFHRQLEQVARHAAQDQVYSAASAQLKLVANHQEQVLDQGEVTMDRKALCCGGTAIPLSDIVHLDIHGKWGIVFSTRDGYYELRCSKEDNALKFFLLYSALKAREVAV